MGFARSTRTVGVSRATLYPRLKELSQYATMVNMQLSATQTL